MKKAIQQLNIVYYSVLIAAITAAVLGHYFLKTTVYIDPQSDDGVVINTFVLLFVIGSMPLTLALFNKLTKKWALLEDTNERIDNYKKGAMLRIMILGFGMMLGILFFYVMNSQSMLFAAGMAAIAYIFCKPSEAKINTELNLENIKD